MLRIISSLLVCVTLYANATSATAANNSIDNNVYFAYMINNTVLCEVGTFARLVKRGRHHLPEKNDALNIKIDITTVNGGSLGLAVSSIVANIFRGNASWQRTNTLGTSASHTFNLSAANAATCARKYPKIEPDVGVIDCLKRFNTQVFAIFPGEDRSKVQPRVCSSDRINKVDASGQFGFPLYVVAIGPMGSLNRSVQYKITITVPPPK